MISGKNLRIALERLDLSQDRAAELVGKSRATIITWLGKGQLSTNTVKLINEKLGIDLSHFFEGIQGNDVTKVAEPVIEELITQFKERLREKDEFILEKDKRIQDKEELISLLKKQIASKK